MCPIITINPDNCHGQPCVRGLRYPVKSVLVWLASGMTTDNILAGYENWNREDILAILSSIHVCQMPLRTESIAAMMS
jgi:uncharacterized protein (DUF433 family)